MSLDDPDLAARIRRFWCNSFASGRVGHDLPGIFEECGLTEIHAEPRTLVLRDLTVAEQVFDLPHLLGRMVLDGAIAPDESAGIRDEIRLRAREGRFSSGYTGFLVQGRIPD